MYTNNSNTTDMCIDSLEANANINNFGFTALNLDVFLNPNIKHGEFYKHTEGVSLK